MSGIWVFVEQFQGEPASVSWEAIGLGRKLAEGLKQPVTAVVFGAKAAAIGKSAVDHGADAAIACEQSSGINSRFHKCAFNGYRKPGILERLA